MDLASVFFCLGATKGEAESERRYNRSDTVLVGEAKWLGVISGEIREL